MTTTKVQSEFIAVNAISGTIIADGAITSTHLAANSVDSSELVTGSIDTIHIAANQITATKIVTNGVLTRHISDDQITADKLANSINTDIAAALPKAGGTMTGDLITTGLTVDTTTLVVDKTNNRVGIGTASPNVLLHLSSSGAQAFLENSDTTSNGSHDFSVTANKPGIGYNNYNHGGYKHVFKTGGSQTIAATIDESGNVGIGTSTPHGKLQFDNNTNTRKIVLYEGADNDYQFYGFGIEGSTLVYSTFSSGDDHVFFSGASTTSRNELMRIEGTGNVGIGTDAPAVSLDISSKTDAIRLPIGTTAQRPTGAVGMIRYNTTIGAIEEFDGTTWVILSSKFTTTGGIESTYTSGGVLYKVHTFTSSGTFTLIGASTGVVDVMMVAGGGGGGAWVGSGGGAGGMIVRPSLNITPGAYTVIVGAGGAGEYNPGGYAGMPAVRTGDDTTAFGLTAKGGGAGVSYTYEYAGGIGGSGSGGANNATNYPGNAANQTSQSGDSGTYGFGNAGGTAQAQTGDPYPGGGGGGAGGAGGNATTTAIGLGGVGKTNNYRTGSNIYYAGGGGGGHHEGDASVTQWGTGGNGGGGNGNTTSRTDAQSGSANTGGGGGGGGGTGGAVSTGGAGGSGIVVVRYVV